LSRARAGQPQLFEWLSQTRDERLFWGEVNARFVQLGQEALYLVTVRDISERKKAEAEREKFVTELESRNAELERFTYTISHDLKSPLVTMKGFLRYLEEDAASGNRERFKKDMKRILDAADNMNHLLSDLLEMTRVGRVVNPPVITPFADLVQDALNIVHGQLQERGITVTIQPDLPAVFGDRQRLVEVLQNLIDNAAKFMGDEQNPQIEIGQQGEDAERGKSVFFVRDNGIGISPRHHEKVFGLFNRLNPEIEGTGIGLALVKRIIEVHGGRIWVESEMGMGAAFYFSLPTK
jgi:signal transduction histidine kinase